MNPDANLAAYPERLQFDPGTKPSYTLCRDRYALGGDPKHGAEILLEFGSPKQFVVRGPAPDDPRVSAVYSDDAGELVLPTGRVFVRFAAAVRPLERTDELNALGLAIEKIPGYAPNAAWLRARSGAIPDGLSALGALRKLPGVEHVEAELLRPVRRS